MTIAKFAQEIGVTATCVREALLELGVDRHLLAIGVFADTEFPLGYQLSVVKLILQDIKQALTETLT